jgi:Skp family chaperone for outer membrane proteins
MKTRAVCRLVLLLALSVSPAGFAAEKNPAEVAYAKAVTAYVDSAQAQMKAIREAVEAIVAKDPADEDKKQQYAGVFVLLDDCDDFVGRLKAASRKQFDPLKAEFERVRGEMVKVLEAAQREA